MNLLCTAIKAVEYAVFAVRCMFIPPVVVVCAPMLVALYLVKDRIIIDHHGEIIVLFKKHTPAGSIVHVGYTTDRVKVVRFQEPEILKSR